MASNDVDLLFSMPQPDGGMPVELVFGDAVLMVGEEGVQKDKDRPANSPRSLGGANTAGVMIYVDDAEAHCERAKRAGAKITYEPTVSDYGEDYWADKSYEAEDFEGHRWWFCERVRG